MELRFHRGTLDLSRRPAVMGVLNVTPDSFSDGGKFADVDRAVERALEMFEEGADIVDIGGESTGPAAPRTDASASGAGGSGPVSQEEELRRVLPVVQGILKEKPDALLSIDTYKASVAERCLAAGVVMVNDVTAGRTDSEIFSVVARAGCPYVLMYAKDPTPRTTRDPVDYDDVIATIRSFFEERLAAAEHVGIDRRQIILDPGMGAFVSGKPQYSFGVLARLEEFQSFTLPLLVSPGRKSFLAGAGNLPPGERLEGTLAATAIAVVHGARLIRTHDVRETRRVVEVAENVRSFLASP